MNARQFSEALNRISEQYIIESVTYQHKNKKKQYFVWAACCALVLILCGFAYVIHEYFGAGSAENIDFDKLTQPFQTISSTQIMENELDEALFTKSNIISDYSNVFADYSVCFTVENGNIPSVYFSPTYMVIFTQEGEKGWSLKKGDQFAIDIALCEKKPIALEIGYILDGKYYELSNSWDSDFSEILSVEKNGDYYFCITNRSSANAVIESGEIKVRLGR